VSLRPAALAQRVGSQDIKTKHLLDLGLEPGQGPQPFIDLVLDDEMLRPTLARQLFACAASLGSGGRPPGDDDRCQFDDKIMNSLQFVDRRRFLLAEPFPLPSNDLREHRAPVLHEIGCEAIDRITRQGDYLQLASVTDMIGLIPAHQHVQANIAKMLIETPLDQLGCHIRPAQAGEVVFLPRR